MKHLKLLTLIILSTVLLFSCSGNNNNKTSSSSEKKATESSTATSSGNASWSCVIDGQPVSGGIIDDGFQQTNGYRSNIAYIDDIDQGKQLLFYLSDPKSTTSQGMHSLRFSVPDKTGSSSFGPDEDGWGIMVDILIDKDNTARYHSDSFTIDITNLLPNRVSGTFSGKFSTDSPNANKKVIEITGGKFDIPIST